MVFRHCNDPAARFNQAQRSKVEDVASGGMHDPDERGCEGRGWMAAVEGATIDRPIDDDELRADREELAVNRVE